MKESLGKKGYTQGNMNPDVQDYQAPMKNYSQRDFSKTTEYVERQDKFVGKETKKIDNQGYIGRYS